MEPERINWNRNSCPFPSEAQSALKPGPTVVRTRKPKFLNRDGYEKPKWLPYRQYQRQLHRVLQHLSGMGSSCRSSPRQWSGFKSVIHPSTPPSAKKIKGTHTLKVIVARMRYINAKPEFERVDQIFIPIVEATATLPHILSEVKQNAGEDYVIVTWDGLEVKESSGTEGFNFWKVSARKFYAIPDDDLRPADARGVKRSRTAAAVLTSHSDNDVLCAISHDVAAIHEKTDAIMSLTKDAKIPLGLKKLLNDALKCHICTSVMKPPLIIAKCCKTLIGCEECINQWYSGQEALTKQCPRCRAERDYNETMRLLGLDDLLIGVTGLLDSSVDF
ncbi:hypothetical protein EMCRGX_G004736 [Ephydatia muelleri]